MTEMITDNAVDYIRKSREQDKPFFLYVAYKAPHYPMHAPKKYVDRFKHLPPDRRIMAAMLSAVDDGGGQIVDELERQGIREETCIILSGDNGPSREHRNWMDGRKDPYFGGSANGFKGEKFTLYEGGLRVPAIANWPGTIPAGHVQNGKNLLPMMTGRAESPHERIFFEQSGQLAVREGKWKLVLHGVLVEGAKPEDDVHLSDLKADPAENRNLKDRFPEIAQRLKQSAEDWLDGIERRWHDEFGHDK